MIERAKEIVSGAVEVAIVLLAAAILVAGFFFSSRRRHTRWNYDWSSDVCSSDLIVGGRHGSRGHRGIDRSQTNRVENDGLARRGGRARGNAYAILVPRRRQRAAGEVDQHRRVLRQRNVESRGGPAGARGDD